jgi:hypothetical protein
MDDEIIRRHADWIRVGAWEDGRDLQTGRAYSSLSQIADFGGTVREYPTAQTKPGRGGRRAVVMEYSWSVSRQRTDREGPDERGRNWSGYLAQGDEPTLARAKSVATSAIKRLRAEHIANGGDVGYGVAPTGEQIRSLASRAKSRASR